MSQFNHGLLSRFNWDIAASSSLVEITPIFYHGTSRSISVISSNQRPFLSYRADITCVEER